MATPVADLMNALGTALSDAEAKQLEDMSSDLRYVLSEFEVPERLQLRTLQLGYKSLATFGVLGDDRAAVRAALKTDFSLDPAEANLDPALAQKARLMTTLLVAAWQSASIRSAEEAKQSADNRLLRLPNLISRTSLVSLRKRFEQDHGRQNDKIYPCASLIERRMEEIEEGGITAPALSEVICIELADDEHVQLADNGTNIKVRKAPKAIPLHRAPPRS